MTRRGCSTKSAGIAARFICESYACRWVSKAPISRVPGSAKNHQEAVGCCTHFCVEEVSGASMPKIPEVMLRRYSAMSKSSRSIDLDSAIWLVKSA